MTLRLKDRFSIVKGLLYLTLGICCVYLIMTGRYLNYIAPRYELYSGISSVALILGGLATIIWAPSRYYKHNWKSCGSYYYPYCIAHRSTGTRSIYRCSRRRSRK